MTDKKKEDQKDKFIKAAKEHGCDETEREFSAKMKKLASQRTPHSETE